MNDNFNNGRIFCTKCGTPNKAGYRFCVRCGAKLMIPVTRPEPEIVQELLKTEPVRSEPTAFEPERVKPAPKTVKFEQTPQVFGVFEEPAPQEEPEIAPQTFGAFEEPASQEEPEIAPQTFGAFEESAPQEEPENAPQTFSAFEEPVREETPEEEPEIASQTFGAFEEPVREETPEEEPEIASQTFGAFEEPAQEEFPQEEPVKAESALQTFSAFEQPASKPEPVIAETVKTTGFAREGQTAFEAEPERQYNGFARSGFMGTTTPTAAAGAFATALDAVKNDKKIDISDAETVMSLLEQGESSALAKGLPEWDIVPPQVVVRRKHRV